MARPERCPNCDAPLKRVKTERDPVSGDPRYRFVCTRCRTKWTGGRDGYLEEQGG